MWFGVNRRTMIALGSIAAIVIAVTAHWFQERNAMDSNTRHTSSANVFFSPDYVTARARFRKAVAVAGGCLESLDLGAKGPHGEDLTIDIARFGSDHPRRVFLHSSGLHGVEAFAGSAIQLQWLKEGLPPPPADAAIILIHVVNPYGMAWLRRFNENNVDLNRNFMASDADYAGAPPAYRELDSFLNPAGLPASGLSYDAAAAWLILRHGLPTLRQAVAGGQYEYPRGLFFGGRRLQQGPQLVQMWLQNHLSSVERAVAVDVHTGLGEYGEDTLLVENRDYDRLRNLFGQRVAPLEPQSGPAYRIRGGYHEMLGQLFQNASLSFVSQEFGTYHSIRVLQALREENRVHHYAPPGVDNDQKLALKEAFSPLDENWRRRVLERGGDLLAQAHRLAFAQ